MKPLNYRGRKGYIEQLRRIQSQGINSQKIIHHAQHFSDFQGVKTPLPI